MTEIEIRRQARQDQQRKERLYLMWCLLTHRTVLTAAGSFTLGLMAGRTVKRISNLEERVLQLEYDSGMILSDN